MVTGISQSAKIYPLIDFVLFFKTNSPSDALILRDLSKPYFKLWRNWMYSPNNVVRFGYG
jgi:hypothetical protein